jgi:L-asparaginase/Glu-tRNA(Gln) amidotransferase subunit D
MAIQVLRKIASENAIDIGFDCFQIANKDSKFIDAKDRALLERTVLFNASGFGRVIITAGTDCMGDLAQDLQMRLHMQPPCPIVFTGAMIPLANGEASDGHANLQLALTGYPDAPPDVYVAMHDLFLPCTQIRKDFEKRRFVRK